VIEGRTGDGCNPRKGLASLRSFPSLLRVITDFPTGQQFHIVAFATQVTSDIELSIAGELELERRSLSVLSERSVFFERSERDSERSV